jgi:hypothetical protein
MIDDGSVSSWVPYSHNGLDAPVSESPCGSDEELQEMEVGDE